ncbi:hypothetical protein AVEN_177116-1 [Araneus ventricosus]|uniref:Uncharacterized protein n=1 Tax=Araneus ventricosus TaxID=182803 RepID=A0A4Y2P508_ARAVE|nr:hypothetical protein AVEN_177116-1 [Araneus ventricosus]
MEKRNDGEKSDVTGRTAATATTTWISCCLCPRSEDTKKRTASAVVVREREKTVKNPPRWISVFHLTRHPDRNLRAYPPLTTLISIFSPPQ